MFNFFLPARRLIEIQPYYSQSDKNVRPDTPRFRRQDNQKTIGPLNSSIANRESGELLTKWIVEANGITNCSSPRDLQFRLLYRASVDGFGASVFHNRCDNKGPTLVLVRSSDNHLFGGVNFVSWASSSVYLS